MRPEDRWARRQEVHEYEVLQQEASWAPGAVAVDDGLDGEQEVRLALNFVQRDLGVALQQVCGGASRLLSDGRVIPLPSERGR